MQNPYGILRTIKVVRRGLLDVGSWATDVAFVATANDIAFVLRVL